MKAELELFRALAEAEDDVKNGKVGSAKKSLDELRKSLLSTKNKKGISKFNTFRPQQP